MINTPPFAPPVAPLTMPKQRLRHDCGAASRLRRRALLWLRHGMRHLTRAT